MADFYTKRIQSKSFKNRKNGHKNDKDSTTYKFKRKKSERGGSTDLSLFNNGFSENFSCEINF